LNLDATLGVTCDMALDLAGATLSGGNARRVIEVADPGNLTYTFVLRGGSIVDGNTPGESGAGSTSRPVSLAGGDDPAVRHTFFSDNHAIGRTGRRRWSDLCGGSRRTGCGGIQFRWQ